MGIVSIKFYTLDKYNYFIFNSGYYILGFIEAYSPVRCVKDVGAVFCAFQTNGKRDFVVGDELRVKCLSFTSKGIPVMSRAEDD